MIGLEDCAPVAALFEFGLGEGGESGFGVVLIFADSQNDVGRLGVTEDISGVDGRTEVLLDVLDDKVSAFVVGDDGRAAGVVHGVGEVADEGDVESPSQELANGERSAKDAHVGVNAEDEDVLDFAGGEEVVYFGSMVGDGVVGGDGDGGVLGLPGDAGLALGLAVAAAVGVVNGEWRFLGKGLGGRGLGPRGGLGQYSLRCVFVVLHGVGGGVDDEDTLVAEGIQGLVHAGQEQGEAGVGGLAPVLVPDVAHDDGGFCRGPLGGGDNDLGANSSSAGAEGEGEVGGGGRREEQEDERRSDEATERRWEVEASGDWHVASRKDGWHDSRKGVGMEGSWITMSGP